MSPSSEVHTVRRDGTWVNEVDGEGPVGGSHRTKDEAAAAGREIANALGARHVIHNIDGSVARRLDPDG